MRERKLAFEFTPDDGEKREQSRQEDVSDFAGKDESVLLGQVRTTCKKKKACDMMYCKVK